jgi:uncharacterized protein (DUF488 family)
MILHSIGVYNKSEEQFFNDLLKNRIELFCDIRQRRGVRGSKYKFVNSNYLQKNLAKIGIKYVYLPQLAPTNEIRDAQKMDDKKNGILKSKREQLGDTFIQQYTDKILDTIDIDEINKFLIDQNCVNILFFCVEEFPYACHRSLVTDAFKSKFGYPVVHLP